MVFCAHAHLSLSPLVIEEQRFVLVCVRVRLAFGCPDLILGLDLFSNAALVGEGVADLCKKIGSLLRELNT